MPLSTRQTCILPLVLTALLGAPQPLPAQPFGGPFVPGPAINLPAPQPVLFPKGSRERTQYGPQKFTPVGVASLDAGEVLVSGMRQVKGGLWPDSAAMFQYRWQDTGHAGPKWVVREIQFPPGQAPSFPGKLLRESATTVLFASQDLVRLHLSREGPELRVTRMEMLLSHDQVVSLGIPVELKIVLSMALDGEGGIIVGLPNGVLRLPSSAVGPSPAGQPLAPPFHPGAEHWLLKTERKAFGLGSTSSSDSAASASATSMADSENLNIIPGMPVAVGPGGTVFVADFKLGLIYRILLKDPTKKDLWLKRSNWLEPDFEPCLHMAVFGNELFILGMVGPASGSTLSRPQLVVVALDEDPAAAARDVRSVEVDLPRVGQFSFTDRGDLIRADFLRGSLVRIANLVGPPLEPAPRWVQGLPEPSASADSAYQELMNDEQEADKRRLARRTQLERKADELETFGHEGASAATVQEAVRIPDTQAAANPPQGIPVSRTLEPECPGGIWETFTRKRRFGGTHGAASSSAAEAPDLDRDHLATYLQRRFLGKLPGSFNWMWRRHAPQEMRASGNWGYPGPKHKHAYEENPQAKSAIDQLLAAPDLSALRPNPELVSLVQQRFTLTKDTVARLTEWILRRCTQDPPSSGIHVAIQDSGGVKFTIEELSKLEGLPFDFQEHLARTGGRTGLTVNRHGQLVWQYGLCIVLDQVGLRTVYASGKQTF